MWGNREGSEGHHDRSDLECHCPKGEGVECRSRPPWVLHHPGGPCLDNIDEPSEELIKEMSDVIHTGVSDTETDYVNIMDDADAMEPD